MNRRIRFRAWNTERKEMVYGVDIYKDGFAFEGISDNPYDFDRETLCQFTGLKDKDGKEIYEGDIVKHYDNNFNYTISKVTYDEKYLCFLLQGLHSLTPEVIGNVWENQELVK